MKTDLTIFIENTLIPEIYLKVDQVFTDHNFKKENNRWVSKTYLNGTNHTTKRDKTYISSKNPKYICENGGESMSIIDYFISYKNMDFIQALKHLCDSVSIQFPEYESKNDEFYKNENEFNLINTYANDYFVWCIENHPKKENTIKYLNSRGYDTELIKSLGIGFIPSFEELKQYLVSKKNISDESISKHLKYNKDIGVKYFLTIPFFSGGKIKGFNFRAIENDITPKYLNTTGLDKRTTFFNIKPFKLNTGCNLNIFESEICALHSESKGITNSVAVGCNYITDEQIKDAIKRGYKQFTLCFDNELKEVPRDNTIKSIINSINLFKQNNIESVYIAELPIFKNDKKADPDSTIINYGAEVLTKSLADAQPFYNWCINQIIHKHSGKELNDKEQEIFLNEVVSFISSIENPVFKEKCLNTFLDAFSGSGVTRETIDFIITRNREQHKEVEQKKALQNLLNNSISNLNNKNNSELLADITNELNTIKASNDSFSNDEFITSYSYEDHVKEMKNQPLSYATKYKLNKQGNAFNNDVFLNIHSSAINIVCAPTSHGKTSFILNLMLSKAIEIYEQRESKGIKTLHLFAYEQTKSDLINKLINAYINIDFSTRESTNIKALKELLINDNTGFIKPDYLEEVKNSINEFFKRFINTGIININRVGFDSDKLCKNIEFLNMNDDVSTIYIDYIQLIYSKKGKYKTYSRTEEIKTICVELERTAVNCKLPLVVGAQFNREVESPLQMRSSKISEASDIEKIASQIIAIWNNKFEINDTDKNIDYITQKDINKEGTIYIKTLKDREGEVYAYNNLSFNGNTGVISYNF